MNQEEVSREAVLKRLKRIEGQLRGLQKMVSEERDCESIVTQLAAVRSAIDSTGALVLNNYMHLCFRQTAQETDTVALDSLARVIGIWGRVRVGD
ncbi:MAG TPA: metal-sensitive transcriptional regulator [Dehalococcoidia bacterium]|nr:metal-sensitive transcriptional regulator [Dehalococcoidia bacterium]